MYQLRGGEYVKGGKLYGWTGQRCPRCQGTGEAIDAHACNGCGGTGEQYDLMPTQPADLPPDTE